MGKISYISTGEAEGDICPECGDARLIINRRLGTESCPKCKVVYY